jgi:hypothetical protein
MLLATWAVLYVQHQEKKSQTNYATILKQAGPRPPDLFYEDADTVVCWETVPSIVEFPHWSSVMRYATRKEAQAFRNGQQSKEQP